jgi:hypothetical protein
MELKPVDHRTPHPISGTARRRTSRARVLLTTLTALLAALLLPALPAHADTVSTFTPGAAWDDSSGDALQMHGLGIIKVGKTWYAYGEDKAGETSANTPVPGDPLLQLDRPQHWTFQGDALTVQASGDLGPNRIVERPKVIYNASTRHT